ALLFIIFFFQAEDGIRDFHVTGVQTCALPISKLVDQIKVFSNGQDALEFLERAADDKDLVPEVILLDINMPILDGWGFLEEFLRSEEHTSELQSRENLVCRLLLEKKK